MHAADRFFPKSKTTGDGFYRGLSLVTLVTRRKETYKAIKRKSFVSFFFSFFFFVVLYYA